MTGRIRAAVLAATVLGTLVASAGTAQAGRPAEPASRDVRAAAMASGGLGPAINGGVGLAATWFTGTVAAGAKQGWTVSGISAGATYVIGFNPAGASTAAKCEFETISNHYVQRSGGLRLFHFTIQNVGSIDCGATVLLSSVTSVVEGSTGGMAPGETQWHFFNVGWDTNWVAGLNPSGATSSADCKFQATRSWYVQPGSDLRQFWVEVKNVGSVTCQTDIRLGSTSVSRTFAISSTGPGGTRIGSWNNANPVTSAYLVGVAPQGSWPEPCQFEVTRVVYQQRINTDGSSERELRIYFKNVGAVTCSGRAELRTIAA
ncbi:hypothetical protein [Allorhizocola rhizosphaerae]|uniref:hypothetical protein n=1 Tax=Allorhizocola rhizosphaerae TaxID=1872709 RepID=UPI000E3D0939|nr:hypothetical protein [Allorhizocola rhizosphaerae]